MPIEALTPKQIESLASPIPGDPGGMERELREIPAILASAGELYACACLEAAQAKAALEHASAVAYRDLRDDALAAGVKITEAALGQGVTLHALYQDAVRRSTEAAYARDRIRAILHGAEARKDVLQTISANMRQEMHHLPGGISPREFTRPAGGILGLDD